jgi:hypothetical protein
MFLNLSTASTSVLVRLSNGILTSGLISAFPATVIPAGNNLLIPRAIVDQPVVGYINAGQVPVVDAIVNFGSAPSGDLVLTGYLLDCTIAPCAAIAP